MKRGPVSPSSYLPLGPARCSPSALLGYTPPLWAAGACAKALGTRQAHKRPEENSKCPLFLTSTYWGPYLICSLIFKKWHRFCRARICRFIFSAAQNIPSPRIFRAIHCHGRLSLQHQRRVLHGTVPPPPPHGCIRRKRTSEVALEAVGQAVGGGCRSGWGAVTVGYQCH